jgi:hypothetical protein
MHLPLRDALHERFTALWAMEEDADRYQWLKSQHSLTLRGPEPTVWTAPNGDQFRSYYLAGNDTSYAPAPTLDEQIDAAMQVDRKGRK